MFGGEKKLVLTTKSSSTIVASMQLFGTASETRRGMQLAGSGSKNSLTIHFPPLACFATTSSSCEFVPNHSKRSADLPHWPPEALAADSAQQLGKRLAAVRGNNPHTSKVQGTGIAASPGVFKAAPTRTSHGRRIPGVLSPANANSPQNLRTLGQSCPA